MERARAEKLVDAIFRDLRDRRFLKLLFCEDGRDMGAILHDRHGEPLMPLDLDAQNAIREGWIKLAMEN